MKALFTTWCLVFSFFISGTSQDQFKSNRNFKEQNRWEGLLEINVSSSPLVLIALHSWRLKEYEKGDNLNITFYLPGENKVSINTRTLVQENTKYKMLVSNEQWKAGWQKFTPWHVDPVLIPNGIKAKDLGVLITDAGSSKNPTYYPAIIRRNDTLIARITQYYGYFYTPEYIDSIRIKVFDMNNTLLTDKRSGKKEPKSTFSLPVQMKENTPEGKYKMDIKFFQNGKSDLKTYLFYHVPSM